jgi:primosomal protein N' (replication factor Y)
VSDLFQPERGPRAAAALAHTRFAHVVVERGIDRVGTAGQRALTYALPDQAGEVRPGQRVVVPLGKGDKPAAGIVVAVGGPELAGEVPLARIKPIARATPVRLTELLVGLAQWMSEYYVCPLGMVFGTMLPAAVKKQTGRKVKTYIELAPDPPPEGPQRPELPKRLAQVYEKVRLVAAETLPTTPRALAAMLDGVSVLALQRLVDAGLLVATTREEVEESRPWDAHGAANAGGAKGPDLVPTPDQQRTIQAITSTLGGFGVHLVHGVTGSGKTEVYLRVMEALLTGPDSGLSAIMLVPEIALTPQTSRRFTDRFGPTVAVLHSGLTASQRHAQWLACLTGRVRVVVGARSALFAPLARVGLIVVDEEHDTSYKQDQLPRYHARDTAIKRAQLEGCPVVLGSATPSLESWHNATALGPAGSGAARSKFALHTLATRVPGAVLPSVRIVDLAEERRLRSLVQPGSWRDRHVHLIGPTLEQSIGEALTGGGQVMLLLNRRGYANYICCVDPACGWVMQCDHCDVTTVYHLDRRLKAGGFVRCHHCLSELALPAACPQCGKGVNTFGLGTQRVETELERKFGPSHGLVTGATMLRLDGDTMQSARDYFQALDRFAGGEVRVLVGTQMIAKGLDYPNVRLVGVISADTALSLPDFRASERTFQLVAQVAGRAGRGREPGRVVVQTMNPEEPAIVLAARHDFARFASYELTQRRAAGLPPLTRMARVVCRDAVLAKAQRAAGQVAALLGERAGELGLKVLGPMPCAIARVSDQHRLAVEVLALSRAAIQRAFAHLRERGLLVSDAHTAVDVDPVALL